MKNRSKNATRDAILATAARVLASRPTANMTEVAASAGIARGTLYRYFPTRQALLEALEAAALAEAKRRLGDANLEQVPVDEALARATRALVAVGEDFIVLLRERRLPAPEEFTAPLVAVFERGQASGEIRGDVPAGSLVEALLALVAVAVRTGGAAKMGSEDISTIALRLLLEGVRPPAER